MFSPNSKRPKLPPVQLPEDKKNKSPMDKATKRRLWITVGVSFLLLFVWFGAHSLGEIRREPMISYIVMGVYFVAFAAILITYLAYNRGFVNKNVTEDMLPDTWSPEKKRDFVEGNRRRAEKSRWMVMLIIPFAVVFMVDALYLFLWDGLLSGMLK